MVTLSLKQMSREQSKLSAMAISRPIIALLLLFALALLPLCWGFSEDHPGDQRILVLLDDIALKSTHSIFFKSLASRGYQLDFKAADDPKLALQRYGKYLYDALILFAPSAEGLGGSLDVASILDFVDSGHDLILAADTSTSEFIREIATECGVDFDEDLEAVVIDHFNYALNGENDHTLIVSNDFINSSLILGSDGIKEEGVTSGAREHAGRGKQAPVLFRGIGHSVNPASSLVVKVLSSSPTAYSANPSIELTERPSLAGTFGLVSVVQARNNARITISGSLDLFSDRFFRSAIKKFGSPIEFPKSGNEDFAIELSKWVFHERGHLKVRNVQHHKTGEKSEPSMYRISDNLEFSVEIYEWSGKQWQPFQANDVQVQFYMMSPYVLKTLTHNKKGLYSTSFQVPDVYGVFQFKVEYKRLGYTSLAVSKQIPVRPFRHNEYERFIPAAYPYYGAAFSMMTGFFIFGLFFLYHK